MRDITTTEKKRILELYEIEKSSILEQVNSATDMVTINLGPYGKINVGVKPNYSKGILTYFIIDNNGKTYNIQEFFTKALPGMDRNINFHDYLNPLLKSPVYSGRFDSNNSIIQALNVLANKIKPLIEKNIKSIGK